MDDACVWGGLLPPPEGASNLQPVLHHAGKVSAQNWSTGERLCVGHQGKTADFFIPILF
jgi:hypothetical protein